MSAVTTCSGAVYGGWHPNTAADLLACEQDPYITLAGVTPDWVLKLRAAALECVSGHPSGLLGRARCGRFGCNGVPVT
jgi:hypothetical protein